MDKEVDKEAEEEAGEVVKEIDAEQKRNSDQCPKNLPRGGWVSGRVIERSIQAGHPACCDGAARCSSRRARPIPPLTKRQSLQHRAGSRHPRPRPTFGSENVRGIGVRSASSP